MKNKKLLSNKNFTADLLHSSKMIFMGGLDSGGEKAKQQTETEKGEEETGTVPEDASTERNLAKDMVDRALRGSTELADKKVDDEKKIKENSLGYPEEDKEDYPDIVKILKEKMEAKLKGREPQHGEGIGHTPTDKHAFLLIYDKNKKDYRLFRSEEAEEKAGAKAIIDPETLKEWSKGYEEVTERGDKEKKIIADIKKSIVDYIKEENTTRGEDNQIPEVVSHKNRRSLIDSGLTDNYEYILIHDENHDPPDRLFTSPERIEELFDAESSVKEILKPGYDELTDPKNPYYQTMMKFKGKVKKHADATSYFPTEEDDPCLVLLKDENKKGNEYRVFKGLPA